MKELFRNPHIFDMSNYYSGHTYVIGGRDFDKEEKEPQKSVQKKESKKDELDWSFLQLLSSKTPSKRI